LGIGTAAAAIFRSQAAGEDVAVNRRADGTSGVRTVRRWRRRRKNRKSVIDGREKQSVSGFRLGHQTVFDMGRFVVGCRRRRSNVRRPTKRPAQIRYSHLRDGQRFVVVALMNWGCKYGCVSQPSFYDIFLHRNNDIVIDILYTTHTHNTVTIITFYHKYNLDRYLLL